MLATGFFKDYSSSKMAIFDEERMESLGYESKNHTKIRVPECAQFHQRYLVINIQKRVLFFHGSERGLSVPWRSGVW